MFNIRALKTTQNKDDIRVLLAGILFAILLIVAKPYLMLLLDRDPENCSYPTHQQ